RPRGKVTLVSDHEHDLSVPFLPTPFSPRWKFHRTMASGTVGTIARRDDLSSVGAGTTHAKKRGQYEAEAGMEGLPECGDGAERFRHSADSRPGPGGGREEG